MFENKTNTMLFLEKATNLSIILGHYDNSQEKYDETSNFRIIPYGDGKTFKIESKLVNHNLGMVKRGILGDNVIKFYNSIAGKIIKGNRLFIQTPDHGQHFYSVADVIDDYSLKLTSPLFSDYTNNGEGITLREFDIPLWLHQGNTIVFKKEMRRNEISHSVDGEIVTTEIVDYLKIPVTIEQIVSNVIEHYFITDIDTKITKNDKFIVQANDFQNHSGIVAVNSIGNAVTFPIATVNNGEIIRCTDFNLNDKEDGVLLFDKLYLNKNGTANGSLGSKDIYGNNSRFLEDFKPEDLIIIDEFEYKIEKILSNNHMKITKPLKSDFTELTVYLTSSIFDDIESIIYGIYDDSNGISQGKFKNIMPIRGGRRIFYKFGAREKIIRNIRGNTIKLDVDLRNKNIYKFWFNGYLFTEEDYTYDPTLNEIKILNKRKVQLFNNYCYFIYYDIDKQNTETTKEYIVLSYDGYKANFLTRNDYLKSLYHFLYYNNFSESLSNNYHEYRDERLDTVRRTKTDKTHKLTFSSYISDDNVKQDSKVLTNDVEYITKDQNNFRLIAYNIDTHSFIVYNQCSINTPSSMTIADDVSLITYTVDFKDKIVFADDRSFGDGRWGKFDLFGLKLIGVY